MKLISFIFIIGLIICCQQKPAIKIDPEFVGNWTHLTSTDDFKRLEIDEEGKGYIVVAGGYTTRRKWIIKNDVLGFGWYAIDFEQFKIDSFPQTATYSFSNNLDSVSTGDRYIWLDGNLYTDHQ